MCGWRASVDDVLQRHGTPSQTEPTNTPEAYSGPAVKRWTLREVSMYGAIPPPVWFDLVSSAQKGPEGPFARLHHSDFLQDTNQCLTLGDHSPAAPWV